MSVTCVLHDATDEQIADLLASPQKIHAFLRWEPPKIPLLDKILRREPDHSEPVEPPLCDLGTSAQAIHYVLTGSKEKVKSPLSFLCSGGRYIGDEDVGYGPARALTSDLLKKVNRALAAISPEDFTTRIDVHRMKTQQVYGAPLPEDIEGLRYFIQDYSQLRVYVSQLSKKNCGVIIQYV